MPADASVVADAASVLPTAALLLHTPILNDSLAVTVALCDGVVIAILLDDINADNGILWKLNLKL